MARILFVTQYYPPEVGAAQVRISETAQGLVRLGHEVTVLTTVPNYPLGIVPPEYQHGKNREEVREGVKVVRVWSAIGPNRGFVRRLLGMISFGCAAGFLGRRRVGKADIIIVVSPPLFTSIAGRVLARVKRCPIIFNVADLWPESAVQMGALSNRLLIALSERLEWTTYKRAKLIWTVTNTQRQTLLRRGVAPEKVLALPTGVEVGRFQQISREQARAQLGWDNRFVLLYAGTIGMAMGLGTVLEAAQMLRQRPDIQLVLVGEGAERAELQAQAERLGLTNVTFLGRQPSGLIPVFLAACDASLVYLRNLPVFQGALPTKMYEAMACGRPVVLGVDGEARYMAETEAQAAIFAQPGDPEALARAVVRLRDDPGLAHYLGENGRRYANAYLDRRAVIARLNEQVLRLAKRRRGQTATVGVVPEPVVTLRERQR